MRNIPTNKKAEEADHGDRINRTWTSHAVITAVAVNIARARAEAVECIGDSEARKASRRDPKEATKACADAVETWLTKRATGGYLASWLSSREKKETGTDDRGETTLDGVYDDNSTSTVEFSEHDESNEKNQCDAGPDDTGVASDSCVTRRHRRSTTQSNNSKKSSETPETSAPTTRRRRRRTRLRVRMVRRRLPVHRIRYAETNRTDGRSTETERRPETESAKEATQVQRKDRDPTGENNENEQDGAQREVLARLQPSCYYQVWLRR